MTDILAVRGFVDELARAGIADAVICPGSRSTPLALALRTHPEIHVRVLLDERSAGFFALGMAKAARRPVAVLTTSGTAAANLLPAVVEASLGRVPLLLLTADRPAELRDRGAAQAIDQVRLFGTYAKWFAELPLLDGDEVTRRHVRSVAGRAVASAVAGPAGPVHVNVPFREPLVPREPLGPLDEGRGSSVITGARTLDGDAVADLAGRLSAVERGLIVAGPQADPALPAALARLAAALDWPILADPLSLARCGPHDRSRVVARGDQLLRPGPWRDAHRPDLVLRVGAPPTSKAILALLEEDRPPLVVLDGDGGWGSPRSCRRPWSTPTPRPRPTPWPSRSGPPSDGMAAAASGRHPRAATAGSSGGSPPIAPPAARSGRGLPASPPRARRSKEPRSPTSAISCPTEASSGPAAPCRCATSTPGSPPGRAPSGPSPTGGRTGSTASSPRPLARPLPARRSPSSSATSPSSTTCRG